MVIWIILIVNQYFPTPYTLSDYFYQLQPTPPDTNNSLISKDTLHLLHLHQLGEQTRNQSDPQVDEIKMIDANPNYATIKHEDGRKSTASLTDLTP